MIIYKATNLINNKVYIGQTIQTLAHRKGSHKRDSKRLDYKFSRAIRKHGWGNFKWEKIDSSTNINDLNDKEIFWIKEYKSTCTDYGYNSMSGGLNANHTQESKNKISVANKGRKHTEETKLKMRASSSFKTVHRGQGVLSKEVKAAMSRGQIMVNKNPEAIRRKSESAKLSWIKYPGRISGEKSVRTKLKNHEVKNIKLMIHLKSYMPDIAKRYNVSPSVIYSIKSNHSWVHIPWPDGYVKSSARGKISDATVVRVKQMIVDGLKMGPITAQTGVGRATIRLIKHNKKWRHIPWP